MTVPLPVSVNKYSFISSFHSICFQKRYNTECAYIFPRNVSEETTRLINMFTLYILIGRIKIPLPIPLN